MNNLISHDFQQAMQILGVFIGLYAIILGLLLGTDQPKLKKQKQIDFDSIDIYALNLKYLFFI